MNAETFKSLFTPLTEEEYRERISVHLVRRNKYTAREKLILGVVLDCYRCVCFCREEAVLNCIDCEKQILNDEEYMNGISEADPALSSLHKRLITRSRFIDKLLIEAVDNQ